MTALPLLVAVALSAGSADELVGTTVKELKLRVPGAWKQRNDEGTAKFLAPSGDAEFALDVFPLKNRIAAAECVEKLTRAVGGTKWEKLSVGAAPAAKKTELDASSDKKEAFETRTYVGCNGRTKWALTFSLSTAKLERFSKVADAVVQSITYVKPGGK